MKKLYKNINTLLMTLTAVLLMSSCNSFLKEEDKDVVIPRTLEQFEAMLHQEGFLDVTWFYRSDIMTDDVQENAIVITTSKNDLKRLYTWHYDVEYTGEGNFTASTNIMWENLYNDVLVANYILERSKDIVDAAATPSAINQLNAEALFLRARAYLELVNIYATPYNVATAKTTQGVPLREGTGITNDYQRASIEDVYNQIESDLKESISLFEQSTESKSLWHPNKKAALLLLSRTYLYKGEWQRVIDTTTELIKLCPLGLYALNKNLQSAVVKKANPEVLHTYGMISGTLVDSESEGVQSEIPIIYRVEGTTSLASYRVSNELMEMYDADDMRAELYFKNAAGNSVTAKWHSKFTELGGYSYRLAEAYLSRAEAYAALGMTTEAMADMRSLLSKRIDGDYTHLLPESTDGMTIRRFIVDQRRLELCFENHRWYDLRRTQSWYPKDITHVFSLTTAGSGSYTGTVTSTETYTLPAGSPNYTFELPLSETSINSTIAPYGQRVDISAK